MIERNVELIRRLVPIFSQLSDRDILIDSGRMQKWHEIETFLRIPAPARRSKRRCAPSGPCTLLPPVSATASRHAHGIPAGLDFRSEL